MSWSKWMRELSKKTKVLKRYNLCSQSFHKLINKFLLYQKRLKRKMKLYLKLMRKLKKYQVL